MPALILLALTALTGWSEPILDINFDDVPEGTVRSLAQALPHRWTINMDKKIFEVADDFPRPPADRPDLKKALRYSGAGGWPAGDLHITWPREVTSGCVQAQALVFLPDKRVPVFVGLTRFNPADWKDAGPQSVLVHKRQTEVWQCGQFATVCRVGWNYIRLVADLDHRLAYAFIRHETKDTEEMIAWEVPIDPGEQQLRANSLYLRTDLGYAKARAYFADLKVEACEPPQPALSHLVADLSHILPPGSGIDLTGLWDLLPVKSDAPAGPVPLPAENAAWLQVVVPGEHEPILRAHSTGRAWFRRKVKLPADWEGKLISVNFGMTRARADIYFNGRPVHTHWQGHSGYAVDVTDAALPGRENELLVLIHNDRVVRDPEGALYPLTWLWMYRTGVGICMPVWLEATPALHVADIFARPSVSEGKLRLDVTVANHGHRTGDSEATAGVEVSADILSEGEKVLSLGPVELSVSKGTSQVVTLEADWSGAAPLWWPHAPHLCTAQVQLRRKAQGQDARPVAGRCATFGFRQVRIEGPDILLNGKRLSLRRASLLPYMNRILDEDWFPNYLEDLRAKGYNCVRIHGGTPERLASVADKMGFLIIPEFAIKSHNLDPAGKPKRFLRGTEHCLDIVREQRNHPCILMWNICNEVYIYTVIRSEARREQLARNLDMLGDLVQQVDPTRTVGYDGDCDLNGLAPTANLHYPWHIFELEHPMPVTRFWLDEGKRPWMGYMWKRDKPLVIGEFYHAPYELRAPWGLTSFMGERAFVHPQGWAEGMFKAYRWADEGLRHARIAGSNPWAVPEPVEKLGVVLRPVLVAVRETNRTFWSGEMVKRTVHVFNDILRDQDYVLRWSLRQADKALGGADVPLPMEAGGMAEVAIDLPMPAATDRTQVLLTIELLAGGKPACETEHRAYSVFPRVGEWPEGVVACGDEESLSALAALGLGLTRAANPLSALAHRPQVLLLAGATVEPEQASALMHWVRGGGRIVWLDAPASSWLPAGLQVSGSHYAVHAFRAVAQHPALSGLADEDMSCWRGDDTVCRATFAKPHTGAGLPILQAGGPTGLDWSPLIEVRQGAGWLLLCQMQLARKAGSEPAAACLLSNLLAARPPKVNVSGSVCLPAPIEPSLGDAVATLGFVTTPSMRDPRVVVLDLPTPEAVDTPSAREAIAAAREGATVVARGLSPASAERLATLTGLPIAVEPAQVFHLTRKGRPSILDGVSNDDLYWSNKELDRDAPITEGSTPIAENLLVLAQEAKGQALTDPPALAVFSLGKGQLVLDQVRWAEALKVEPVHAARIGTRLLANLGAKLEPEDTTIRREFSAIDLTRQANRGFRDEVAGDGKGGWTDEGIFDMRHFPVNRTGFDPQGNPMPKPQFPDIVRYGGVQFALINPEKNHGSACIVLGQGDGPLPTTTGPVKVARTAHTLWLLHAADGYWDKKEAFKVAGLTVRYADGETATTPLVNTRQLHDWRVAASLSEGWIGWMGGNGRHSPCVLYVWGWRNPRPEVVVDSIELEAGDKYRYILVAATCEAR